MRSSSGNVESDNNTDYYIIMKHWEGRKIEIISKLIINIPFLIAVFTLNYYKIKEILYSLYLYDLYVQYSLLISKQSISHSKRS